METIQSSRCDAFLSVFDRITANEIKRFALKISSSKADVFLVMARKAICLIDALVELGYIDRSIREKTIWTDRVLDMDGLDCLNKKIDIIDDVIISGSTIAKAISKLLLFGGKEADIKIKVLAVNSSTFSMDFGTLLDKDSYMQLKEEECIELSSNIAKALNILGHPYDIDFPSYHEIVVSNETFQTLLSSSGYEYFEVNNINHTQNGIIVLTLMPYANMRSLLWRELGSDLDSLFHIKLRIYAQPIVEAENFRLKIVPMVIIQETPYDLINKMFDCFQLSENISKMFVSYSSKTRLIQYIIAAKLISYFFSETISEKVVSPNSYKMSLIFGEEPITAIEKLVSQRTSGLFKSLVPEHDSNRTIELLGFVPQIKSINNYDMTDRLVEPFEHWYDTAEKEARKTLKKNGISYRDNSIINSLNRLDIGFSFTALKSLISDAADKYNIEAMVSIFIDRAVDFGMIVPILYEHHGLICRAYRHGEDFLFTKQDRDRLKYFLKVFYETIKSGGTAKIPTEKIIVLFLQLGIRPEFSLLNQFKDFDNDGQLLTVKYCIHGAVANVIDNDTEDAIKPYVVQNKHAKWLSEKFVSEGILQFDKIDKEGKKGHYSYSGGEVDSISGKAKASIDEIAELIANWYNYSVEDEAISTFTESAIALTSCITEEMFASAILAELHISAYDWENSMKPALLSSKQEILKRTIIETRKNINPNRSAFVAMNSGRMKYLYYERSLDNDLAELSPNTESIQNIIDNVFSLFDRHNDNFKRVWSRIWAEYKETVQSDTDVTKYVDYCVRYLYLFNICYRLIELLYIVGVCNDGTIKSPEIIRNEIDALLGEYRNLVSQDNEYNSAANHNLTEEELFIHSIISLLDGSFIFNTEIRRIVEFLDQKVSNSILVRKKVEDYIQANRPLMSIHCYESAIVFDVSFDKLDKARDIVEKICFEYKDIDSGITIFDRDFTDSPLSRIVLFSNHPERMIDISKIVHKDLLAENITFRTIFIPKLGSEIVKLSPWGGTKNNESKTKFFRNVLRPIDQYLGINHKNDSVGLVVIKNYNDFRFENAGEEIIKSYDAGSSYSSGELTIASGEKDSYKCGIETYSLKTVTIGIVTFIPPETTAINEQFNLNQAKTNNRYFYKNIYSDNNGNAFRLVHTQTLITGGDGVKDALNALETECSPDFFVTVGVGGSFSLKDCDLCDVIIPKKVLDLRNAKETEGKIKYDTVAPMLHPKIVAMINAFSINNYDRNFISESNILTSNFKCVYEPVADNGHVISDTNSSMREQAILVERKTLSVDTESAAANNFFWLADLDEKVKGKLLIIRGISDDTINKPDDDRYHKQASCNAAQILKEFLPYFINN